MKNLKAPFLVIALLLLNFAFADSTDMPVPYTVNDDGSTTEDDDGFPGDPSAPGYPIDENTVFLLVSGLALGGAVIYKKHTKKASI